MHVYIRDIIKPQMSEAKIYQNRRSQTILCHQEEEVLEHRQTVWHYLWLPESTQSRATIGLHAERHTHGVPLVGPWWSAFKMFTRLFLFHYAVKTLFNDTFYNSKILYNVSSICTNVLVLLEFELITQKFS